MGIVKFGDLRKVEFFSSATQVNHDELRYGGNQVGTHVEVSFSGSSLEGN